MKGEISVIPAIIIMLISTGIFFVVADFARIPLIKTSKAFHSLSKRQKKKTNNIELWLKDLATWVSKHLKINEYKRMQLLSDLKTANMNITPELHISNAIIKSGLCALLAIPAFFAFPLVSPLVVAIAITMYFKESQGIQERIKIKRSAIEYELPRFVFTIEKTLSHNRDVLCMLESFKENAAPEIKYELAITVADMRSGNYESALTRLEARVGSPMLSDVTRGLIGILRGDETQMYWISLSLKLADAQRQMLKQQAQKVPGKIKRLSMVLLFCFIATYVVVLGMQIMSSLGALF